MKLLRVWNDMINDKICILGWIIPLKQSIACINKRDVSGC